MRLAMDQRLGVYPVIFKPDDDMVVLSGHALSIPVSGLVPTSLFPGRACRLIVLSLDPPGALPETRAVGCLPNGCMHSPALRKGFPHQGEGDPLGPRHRGDDPEDGAIIRQGIRLDIHHLGPGGSHHLR